MRILLTYAAVGRGGDAVQLLSLADAMRARGHEVTLVGSHPLTPYVFDTTGARIRDMARRLPWWARDLAELVLALVAVVRAGPVGRARRVDLLVHRAGTYDIAVGCLARRLSVPLVLYLDACVDAERLFRRKRYWQRLHLGAIRKLEGAASLIVTPSRAIAEYYLRSGVPAGKIMVQQNGVSERHLRMGLEAARRRPPLSDTRYCTLGFVGSLAKWHGVEILLDVLSLLRGDAVPGGSLAEPEIPTYRLLIVGRGEEYHMLRERAHRLGLGDAVEWRGALPHDGAVSVIQEFDIAILPNTLPTGAPMKLVEYAAMGRSIVAPDYPNIRDMFVGGVEIMLVEPGDHRALAKAIRYLVANPQVAQAMGRAAQERVAAYTWERAVDLVVQRVKGESS